MFRAPSDPELLKVISEETRMKIITLLHSREMTNSEIASSLNLSKSTITHHLKMLERAGAVEVSRFEETSRGIPRKFYRLSPRIREWFNTEMPGTIRDEILHEIRQAIEKGQIRTIGDGINVAFLRLLKAMLLSGGDQMIDMMYREGYRIGSEVLSEKVEGSNLREILENISQIWRELSLGEMEILKIESGRAVARVSECYQCANFPNVGKPLCPLDEGIITGILETLTRKKYTVKEVKCWGTGHPYCEFEITCND